MSYSAAEVAELLGWPGNRVYGLVRDGLVKPGRNARGHLQFTFPDLVVLRAIRELIRAGVPARRVRRSLKSLRSRLPDGRPLSTLRMATAGSRVIVREGTLWFEPDTGQGQLPLGEAVSSTPGAVALPAQSQAQDSDHLYHRGLELEDSDLEAAEAAYRQAIAADDGHADAHINLGRLLQGRGDLMQAASCYRAALDREPGHPLAEFNLGTVREDEGQIEAAIGHYQRCADQLPDAHYNLARIYEERGDRARAIAHLRALKLLCH